MIWGSITRTGKPDIINVTWPKRMLVHVRGTFREEVGGEAPVETVVNCYVWDDCRSDAIKSAAEWAGCDGADDTHVRATEVTGVLRARIKAITDRAHAEETYTP